MPQLIEPDTLTDEDIEAEIARKRKYCVVAFNNEATGYNEVLETLMRYCGYQFEQADHYVRQVHQNGKGVVYWESKEKCDGLVSEFKKIKVSSETQEN
jgi:ATP-dependent Clp protease adapter protein ClpS